MNHYMQNQVGVVTSYALERSEMRIWVDADACPVVIKEILFKAAPYGIINGVRRV